MKTYVNVYKFVYTCVELCKLMYICVCHLCIRITKTFGSCGSTLSYFVLHCQFFVPHGHTQHKFVSDSCCISKKHNAYFSETAFVLRWQTQNELCLAMFGHLKHKQRVFLRKCLCATLTNTTQVSFLLFGPLKKNLYLYAFMYMYVNICKYEK